MSKRNRPHLIIEDERLKLTARQQRLLSACFADCHKLYVHKKLGGSFRGTPVFLVTGWREQDKPLAPQAVKLGHQSDLTDENRRYQAHVGEFIPTLAAPMMKQPISRDDWGVMTYSFIGTDVSGPALSFQDYYLNHSPSQIKTVLDQLFQTLGQQWYQHQAQSPLGDLPFEPCFDHFYGPYFPPDLTLTLSHLSPSPLPQTAEVHPLSADSPVAAYQAIEVGTTVQLNGLTLHAQKENRLEMLRRQRPSFLRLKIDPVPDPEALRPGQPVWLRGQVTAQRHQGLVEKVAAIFDHIEGIALKPKADRLRIDASEYANPLSHYPTYLNQSIPRNFSTLHGDLHALNIIIDGREKPWLIDFGAVGIGHRVFDFIKLEQFLRQVINQARSRSGQRPLTVSEVVDFERRLIGATGAPEHVSPPPGDEDLAKAFKIIHHIRQWARAYMIGPNPFRTEYYPALLLHALAALKHHDPNDHPTSRHTFIAAVRLLAYLQDNLIGLSESDRPLPGASLALTPTPRPLAELPLDDIPPPAPLPPGSQMPFSPNPLFVGREVDLQRLAEALKGGETIAIGPIAATTGLGGIGKTQLASEFAHRYGQFFAGGVFWLSFGEAEAIPTEIARCGRSGALDLRPDFGDLPLEDQVRLVRQAWQEPVPRLLVFDNCDDEALLARWRPPTGRCRVLVTSRRSQWDPALGLHLLTLGVLSRTESVALLRHFRPDLAEDDADLDAIAAVLGDLPLALHLAGSFLKRYKFVVTPAAYLTQLRQPQLLEHPSLQGWKLKRETSPTRHEQHVARTFAASFQRLDPAQTTDALAINLLTRAAYFATGEPIPRALLRATVAWPDREAGTALQIEDALIRLLELGLVQTAEEGAIRLHRLLAMFGQGLPDQAAAQTDVEQAILAVIKPLNRARDREALLPLQAHLRVVTDRAFQRDDQLAANLCIEMDYFLATMIDFAGARPYSERALAIRERIFGPDHPETAWCINSLAVLLWKQGDYEAARPLFERSLALTKQALGSSHLDVAKVHNNLGTLLYAQGHYRAARPHYEQALNIREQRLGRSDQLTAKSLLNLGHLLIAQGEYAPARPLVERAYDLWEKQFGVTHPNFALVLNNLAVLQMVRGDYEAARSLYERSLAVTEQLSGEDSPDAAISLERLGLLIQAQGHYQAARPLLDRALALNEQALGPTHPRVASNLSSLAMLLKAQGDYPAAHSLLERALTICEPALGPNHPETGTVLHNLAILFEAQGAPEQARPLAERALAIRQQALGSTHPKIADSLETMGQILHHTGDLDQARRYYEQALALREAIYGLQHPKTARSLNHLGELLRAQGDLNQAQPYHEQALGVRLEMLGEAHPDTAESLQNLALLLRAQNDETTARTYLQWALSIYEQVLGPGHPQTRAVRRQLAEPDPRPD